MISLEQEGSKEVGYIYRGNARMDSGEREADSDVHAKRT
jgi:hypothetical protein